MNILQMISQIQKAQNPMAMIQEMFNKNPQFNRVMQATQGKSPEEIEQLVRNTAKTQGVDINELARRFGFNIN